MYITGKYLLLAQRQRAARIGRRCPLSFQPIQQLPWLAHLVIQGQIARLWRVAVQCTEALVVVNMGPYKRIKPPKFFLKH